MIETKAVPTDQAARVAALDTARSFIVQAPAGSGKTELLTQRFLQLLSEVDSPEQILAITFTRAATAEMRRRILESLESAQRGDGAHEPSLEPARRALQHADLQGWDLLKHPQLLKIETIDSFCLSVAHRTPLLARLGGAFQPTPNAGPLYALAARRTLQRLAGDDIELSAAISALLELRDNGLVECETLIATMLARRDQWQHAYVLNQEKDWQQQVRVELEAPMARTIRRTLGRLAGMLEKAGALDSQFAALARFACENLQLSECEKHSRHLARISLLATLTGFPLDTEEHVDVWRAVACFLLTTESTWRKGLNVGIGFPVGSNEEKNSFHDLISRLDSIEGFHDALCEANNLPPAHYTDEQWDLLRKLFVTLRRATAELNAIFAEQNTVDFVEIGLAAGRVLEQRDELLGEIPTEYALAKSDQLRHLLVDEFQDTSRRQQRLLALLVRGWSAEEGRTCFMVGDPMQSIYLFRQAEVELFHQASSYGLGSGRDAFPLKRLQLTTNFRSDRGVVDPLNKILAPIFAQASSPDAAPVTFTPSEANDPEAHAPNVHIVANLLPPPASGRVTPRDKKLAQEVEASQVLNIVKAHLEKIEQAIRNKSSYTLAILVRARKHLLPIAHALRTAGIPFRAVEMENLSERQEVLDLLSLLRALLHPMDRVAWLSILRAPWCGLTLADLHQLCGADDRSSATTSILELLRTRTSLLSADGAPRARKTHAVLEEGLRQRCEQPTSQPLAVWMERLWWSLGGPDCCDATAYENAQVFFSMLEEVDADAITCLGGGLDEKLTRLFAQPDPAAYERAGVQLMTIHKAKGLGFDVVVLPGLERKPNADKRNLLSWLERSIPSDEWSDDRRDSEILVAPIGGKGEPTDSLCKWVNKQERMRSLEEQKRLFYVACTRARHELHLVGTALINEKVDSKSKEVAYTLTPGAPDSLLKTAWPGLEASFDQALVTWQTQRGDLSAEGSGLLLFPAFFDDQTSGDINLAAGEDRQLVLRRIPDHFVPETPRVNVTVSATYLAKPIDRNLFTHPAGSIQARAFGVAVHALLARSAQMMNEGVDPSACSQALRKGKHTIGNLLRREGIPAAQVLSLTEKALLTIDETITDPIGRWILSPHAESGCEVEWTGWLMGAVRTVRADRVFRSGSEVASAGDEVYWIIDYKTSNYSGTDMIAFLAQQKLEHLPQLQRYADVLRLLKGAEIKINLGLYYPLLRKLHSWSS